MIALLTRVKIGPRLAASFFTLLLAMSALCGLALWSLAELSEDLAQIKDERLPKVERLVKMSDNVSVIARQTRNLIIFDDAAKQAGWIENIAKVQAENQKLYALVVPAIRSEQGRKLVEIARVQGEKFNSELNHFMGLMKNGQVGEATDLLDRSLRDTQRNFIKALDDIKQREIERIGETADHGQESYRFARSLVLVFGAALLGLGGLLCWAITRSIVAPLRRAVRDAERMAAGDLSAPVKARGHDEAAAMLRALGGMQAGLRQIVTEVREGVASVATASHQIAIGNQDLSARTEEQASSLQQTAASMEQISGNVRAGAESAAHADKLALAATGIANSGGQLVERAVAQINELEAASKRIADIVGVIDGIAFQTNLLALNAAVEAARAGESGRGFAVVAGEVRNLAGRCAEAAREIKGLVGSSVEQVQGSSATVRSTGQVMGEIVEQIRLVSTMVAEINSTTQEQDKGIAQVHQAVGELDLMTQNNAALVEESAAAAESLRQQAERLTASVASFRLEAAA